MTLPMLPQLPPIQQGGTIQAGGNASSIASGIAGVLAQMQVQRENEFKLWQLRTAQAQQEAQQAYYEAQAANQAREQARLEDEARATAEGKAAVGGAIRRVLTPAESNTTAPQQQPQPQSYQWPPQGVYGQSGVPGASQEFAGSIAQALAPVADQYVPAALEGIQKAIPAPPKPEELPTTAKEALFYESLPTQKLRDDFLLMKRAGATNVTQNVGGTPTEFSKGVQQGQAKNYTEVLDQAKQSYAAAPAIKEAYDLVKAGKVITGFGAKQRLWLSRVAAQAGMDSETIKASDTQTLYKLAGDQVLAYLRTRVLGTNNAVSDSDRQFMESQTGRDITQTPLALRKIMRINFGAGIQRQTDAIATLEKYKQIHPEEAEGINIELQSIKREAVVTWRDYARMLKDEGESEAEIRARIMGLNLAPEQENAVLNGIPKSAGPNIQKLGDDIFGKKQR